jgi:hypothetical protein
MTVSVLSNYYHNNTDEFNKFFQANIPEKKPK